MPTVTGRSVSYTFAQLYTRIVLNNIMNLYTPDCPITWRRVLGDCMQIENIVTSLHHTGEVFYTAEYSVSQILILHVKFFTAGSMNDSGCMRFKAAGVRLTLNYEHVSFLQNTRHLISLCKEEAM